MNTYMMITIFAVIFLVLKHITNSEKKSYRTNGTKHTSRLTNRQIEYRHYLQGEHWKEVRQQALRNADYHCSLCGAVRGLQVHHNTYKNLGHENMSDLVVLCRDCHAKFHNKNKYSRKH